MSKCLIVTSGWWPKGVSWHWRSFQSCRQRPLGCGCCSKQRRRLKQTIFRFSFPCLGKLPCTVTESLVRISWGGTSKVIVLRSTILISSMQGMMKNRPGPMAPPCYQQWIRRKICQYLSYLLQSSKPEDDGSLVLRYDTNAEEDGNWEGEDDKEDGDGFQQERTAIKALLRAIIVIHRHNLEIKTILISGAGEKMLNVVYLVLGWHFLLVLFSCLLFGNN